MANRSVRLGALESDGAIVDHRLETMLRVYAFIDGGYVRSGLEKLSVAWQDVNLSDVVAVAVNQWIGGKWQGEFMGVSRAFIYDAVADNAAEDDPVMSWLDRHDQLRDVHVRRGGLAGDPKKGMPRRQKAVDVQLAVDALTFAARGVFDVALFVTGDADFVPVAEAVRDSGPLVAVCGFRESLAEGLQRVADRVGNLPEDPNAWTGWRLPDEKT